MLVVLPSPAFADIVLPSVVKMLSAAGPYSLMLFPIVITVPLLVAIGFIEALVVRKSVDRIGLLGLTLILFVINAVTSAIGLFVMPNGTELWPGILLAYLATTIIEGLLLLPLAGPRQRLLNALRASAFMNLASYAFLTAILAAAIYLPGAQYRDNLPVSELKGTVLLSEGTGRVVCDIVPAHRTATPHTGKMFINELQPSFTVITEGGKRYVVDTKTSKKIGTVCDGAFKGNWEISRSGRFYANWVYGDAKRGYRGGDLIVGDTKTGKAKAFASPENYIFAPTGSRIAITYNNRIMIYDAASGRSHTIKPSAIGKHQDVEWSPDGKYVAYVADLSPFNHDLGESYADAIRVIDVETGRSTTIYRQSTNMAYCWLRWIP